MACNRSGVRLPYSPLVYKLLERIRMENHKWFLYIIYSESLDKYYTGITQNLEDRVLRHNHGRSLATKGGRVWQLKYTETFSTRSDAQQREYEIKGKKSRKYVELMSGVG